MFRQALFASSIAVLAACTPTSMTRDAQDLIDNGNVESGLMKLEEAARRDPSDRDLRRAYFRQRELALQRFWSLAETARQQGQAEASEAAYRRMLAIDPSNVRARNGLDALRNDKRHKGLLAEADELLKKGNSAAAEARARTVLTEAPTNREAQQLLRRIDERALRAATAQPKLSAAMRQPVTLEFREATLRMIFEALARSTGLNFVFDREVRQDLRTTIFVRNSSVEDVLRFVLVTNQLERKVLSENTVLVYPNTTAKIRDYQELLTKTFYLANADVKTTATMIRSLVKTKDVHVDEKLNVLVMRDTPDAIRMAERLIANLDLAEPEVMLEVEVLEVSSNTLQDLGIRWPDSISFSLIGAAGVAGQLTGREARNINSDLVRVNVSNPFLALNFREQLGRSNLLANPRIRVKNKDKARVHIGDKVPVITTTTTTTGFASESVTYLDVGLKLDVEPQVFLEDEVGIKVGLEVSNIAREIRSSTGTLTYQVGTRNAATSLRLKDGETQILAGLISDEDRKVANQVPGIGDLPVVGRLFGSHQDTVSKTEIVLLITPRVVRNLTRPELRFEEFSSGTEAAVGAAPLVLQSTSVDTPAGSPGAAATSSTKINLLGPASVAAGQEFDVQITVDTAQALRSGLLDLSFDASRLRFIRADPGAHVTSLRASAPEGVGRASLSVSATGDINGTGELAKVRFQAIGDPSAPRTIRMEAVSFTNSAGQVVVAPLPPMLSLSIAK